MSFMARCFTATFPAKARALTSKCHIAQAFSPNPDVEHVPDFKEFQALWDTGATNTVITQEVVDRCGLLQTGLKKCNTVNGCCEAPTYLISIRLPNELTIQTLQVACLPVTGTDILIGMDIIGMGDFAISNFAGKTTFSFRCPSVEKIDLGDGRFRPAKASPVQSLNSRCSCGSGLKAKRCCLATK